MATLKYRDPTSGQWVPLLDEGAAAAADARYVRISGGAMSGALVIQEPTAPEHAATKQYADSAVPAGAVVPFGGATEPAGWFFCQGQAVSRTTYPALFAAIGGTYGVGDGSTTFNLPDIRGRSAVGVDAAQGEFATLGGRAGEREVVLTGWNMPNWTGSLTMHNGGASTILASTDGIHAPGGGSTTGYHSHGPATGGAHSHSTFSFSLGFSGWGHNNMMYYRVTHYIIKAI
jgi:microcystin-dependent protein